MYSTFLDIIDKWAKLTQFNPNQTNFSIPSMAFEFNRCGKTMQTILNNYDQTGMLAVMYMREQTAQILSQATVHLMDLINDRTLMDGYYDLFDSLSSPEVKEADRLFVQKVVHLLSMASDRPAIGDVDQAEILNNTSKYMAQVLPNVNKLNLEVYTESTGIDAAKLPLASHIRIVPTLAHALTQLETAQDGIYIIYLNQYNSVDGYFGCSLNKGAPSVGTTTGSAKRTRGSICEPGTTAI